MFDVYINTYGWTWANNFSVSAKVNRFTLDALLDASHASSDIIDEINKSLVKGISAGVSFEARGGNCSIRVRKI